MKKWITSNYHYMVPEFDESTKIEPNFSRILEDIKRGVSVLGANRATPVILGPVSLIRLTKISAGATTPQNLIQVLIPVYKGLLEQIASIGVEEIQIHEPALVFDEADLLPLFQAVYPEILPSLPAINMVSFMDDVGEDNYKWLTQEDNGISIVSLDFTRGKTLEIIQKQGFPASKILGAGMIDSRNVWKVEPKAIRQLIEALDSLNIQYRIQPSGSLQYTPWDLDMETDLIGHPAINVLSFAKQKLDEIVLVAAVASGTVPALARHEIAWETFHEKRQSYASSSNVRKRIDSLEEKDFNRNESYEIRRPKQLVGVPPLPTTTIGSFPQTVEIRRFRNQWKKQILSDSEYEAAMDQQIALCIGIQEALGLDILVHGEPERTDMVEFFAQNMEGMLFTQNGWVQSFGSRCVRPPIFWNDICRSKPMTVREFKVAQALTKKPVKGMLTGPITILNWSFPRIDISRKEQAFQIALGIRDEISDLEEAGCKVIQVDEPALREGMPLRLAEKDEYLKWAVDAFRLSTAGAKSETQVHTHMCYCEFDDCMEAIDRMDTDVNSIENARSDNATLAAFLRIGYSKGFGPGLYDIHSPVVPPVDSIASKLLSFLEVLSVDQTVVNPDCGLKTRGWPETIAALRNMVQATEDVRKKLGLVKANGDILQHSERPVFCSCGN